MSALAMALKYDVDFSALSPEARQQLDGNPELAEMMALLTALHRRDPQHAEMIVREMRAAAALEVV